MQIVMQDDGIIVAPQIVMQDDLHVDYAVILHHYCGATKNDSECPSMRGCFENKPLVPLCPSGDTVKDTC